MNEEYVKIGTKHVNSFGTYSQFWCDYYYKMYRSGSTMNYRLKVTMRYVNTGGGTGTYQDPINANFKINYDSTPNYNKSKQLKGTTYSNFSNGQSWTVESDWFPFEKLTGTTKCQINVNNANTYGFDDPNYSFTLNIIPALSTIVVNNNTSFAIDTNENVSNTIPVLITKYDDDYTQKLKISMKIGTNSDGSDILVTIRDYTDFESDTLTFSESELTTIYNNASKGRNFWFYFDLDTYNENTKLGTSQTIELGYLSMTDLKPTFNDFVYADWNQTTLALTGNGYTLIKGYSTAGITVSGPNIATAHKGATISKYTAINGSQNDDYVMGEYPATMQIEKVMERTMSVWAIDSRGFSTKVDKLAVNWIDYKDIEKISFTAERKNGETSSEVTLKLSGNIFDGNFGAVENSIKSATYKYKKTTDGEDAWIEGTTSLNVVKNGSSYSLEQDIVGDLGALGFDQESSYDIYVEVEDQLSKVYDTFTLGVGSPAIDIYGNCVALGQPYNEDLGGRVQILGNDASTLFNKENNVITVGMFGNVNQSLTNTSTDGNTINLDTIICQVGNKLTFDSNYKAIVIGEGISKVLVSSLMTFSDSSSNPQSRQTNFGASIYKNGNVVSGRSYAIKPTGIGGSYYGTTNTPVLIDVIEGDKITLNAYTNVTQVTVIRNSDATRYNYLTVQVVE